MGWDSKYLFTLLTFIFIYEGKAQQWQDLNGSDFGGASIFSVETIGESLFIGGGFNELNGNPTVGTVVWDSLDVLIYSPGELENSGGNAFDHADYNGDIIICGEFNSINGINNTSGVGAFNGDSWYDLNGGGVLLNDDVRELEVYDGEMYISDGINNIGNVTDVFGFARWNGSLWENVESPYGFDVGPIVMTVFDGKLWGGGDLNTTTEGTEIYNVAYFDGNQWVDPNGGMAGRVQALYADEEEGILYVAGNGSLAQYGDVECPNSICFWDGLEWHGVGEFNEINFDIKAIAKYQGQIYVGGYFQLNGNTEKLAYFDGVHWNPVPGAGTIEGSVDVLEVYKGELYVGGTFPEIGGVQSHGIARYYLHPDSVVWGIPDTTIDVIEQINRPKLDISVFPNPADNQVTIQFNVQIDHLLVITDSAGRVVHKGSNHSRESELIETSLFSPGVYFCLLKDGANVIASQRFFVK